MKKLLLTFTHVSVALAMVWMVAGCATTAANSAAIHASKKEMLLTQAGFTPRAVTTPKQQQEAAKLAAGVVSAVTIKGKLHYVYPTGKNQILLGRQHQYDAYKKLLQAAMAAQRAQQQNNPDDAYLTGETAGPDRMQVDVLDGFEPMQDNPMWQ